MNIKDCINIIKNCTTLACEYHIKNKCNYSYEVRENRFECAKEQAIKALEKQIPKNPVYQGEHEKCPSCGSFYIEDFCAKCGQKIKWY